jgi:hypothetical protein
MESVIALITASTAFPDCMLTYVGRTKNRVTNIAQKVVRRFAMLVFVVRIWTAIMIPEYDIFRIDTDGTPVWLRPANTLNDARTRIQQLRGTEPGDGHYFIFNQTTAEKIVLKAGPQASLSLSH